MFDSELNDTGDNPDNFFYYEESVDVPHWLVVVSKCTILTSA